MKIKVTFEVDGVSEAREVLSAVEKLGNLPYRLDSFGAPLVKGELPTTLSVDDAEAIEMNAGPSAIQPPPRKNISPGEPSISKIGGASRDLILSELSTGAIQPHAKYVEHLKLLWKRGEVKYDGKEYYL